MSKSRNDAVAPDLSDLDEWAEIFSALSHPHRLRIFLKLADRCRPRKSLSEFEAKSCVAEAGKGLKIAPSTLSHHINELRRAGLIRMERSGKAIDCWVEVETLRRMQNLFKDVGCC